jgi:flagellar motor switch protein FliN/FliY
MAGIPRNGDGMNQSQQKPSEQNQPLTIATVENARLLLDRWAASLTQVLESMADRKPDVTWQPGAAPDPEQEVLWWEQPFKTGQGQTATGMTLWVAAPRATWESVGTLTLKAAGLETVETAEARSTWIEILGQSLSAMARSIGSFLGREVTCADGRESSPRPGLEDWASASLSFGESPLAPLSMAFSPEFLSMISAAPSAAAGPCESQAAPDAEPEQADRRTVSATMDLLMDVELAVSISFGKTQLPMKDVLKLTTGSIVELNRMVNETVEVLVNHCLIARGEVVVVDGNYGVRIQQIASKQDRLRSTR